MEYANLLFDTIKKTLRHSLIYGLGTSFMAVVGVILIPLYTRFLSPSEYGVYSLIGVVFTLLIFVYDFGMINALFRWVYQFDENQAAFRKRVVSTTLIFLIILASILTFILWKCASLISSLIFANTNYAPLIKLMLISIFLQSLTWVPLSLLRIEGKALIYTIILICGMVVMVITNFILLLAGSGVKGIYESYIVASLFIMTPLFYITRHYYGINFSVKDLNGMLKFGLPLFPVLFFSWIIDFSGRYFIGRYSTLQEVGLYSVGYKIGQILYLAEKTFMIAWTPIMLSLSQRYMEKAPQIFGKIFTYFIFLSLLIFLFVSVYSVEIVKLFTSPSYYGASSIVPLISLSYLLYGVYIYMLSGLIITKNISVQPLILLGSAIANVILNIALIPKFGMMGSAYATISSYCIAAIATYCISQKYYPLPIETWRIAKICTSTALIYFLSTSINFTNTGLCLASKTILMAAFFYALYVIRFYQPAEIDRLKFVFTKRNFKDET